MSKRESFFSKAVGGTPEQQEEALRNAAEVYKHPVAFKEADGQMTKESRKSPELEQAINGISNYLYQFLREFDASHITIRPDQVHFIEKPKEMLAREAQSGGCALGSFAPGNQQTEIYAREGDISKTQLAQYIAHEMIHANSFGSMDVEDEGDGNIQTSVRRIGISVLSGKFGYLRGLNEAVTQELTIRFAVKYFPQLSYTQEEMALHKSILPRNNNQAFLGNAEAFQRDRVINAIFEGKKDGFGSLPYFKERLDLYKMVGEIFEANKDQFKDEEEVFRIFVNAMLKGRLLPLARIIDKTYGEGSFRNMAEETEERPGLKNKDLPAAA